MNEQQQLEIAARVFEIHPSHASMEIKRLANLNALYVWQQARGGGAVIVSEDGSFLFANSSVSPEQHEAAFVAGKRSAAFLD